MFLQEKENLTRMIIAKSKEMVLRDMHATPDFSVGRAVNTGERQVINVT